MQVGLGDYTYTWHNNWATVPESTSSKENGRTHGICQLKDGSVIVFHQAENAVVQFDPSGKVINAWGGDRFMGAHGLTYVVEGSDEFIWLTDQDTGEVVKATPTGEIVQEIKQADHVIFKGDDPKKYSPTWVAQNPSNGDIWVTDGYGSFHIFRYDKDGNFLMAINGEEGPDYDMGNKAFACPHGIDFDTRGGKEPELYVADRSNQRIRVYDGEGNHKRIVGALSQHSPCMFSFAGDYVLVPQLLARIDVLDKDDNIVAMLGDNGQAVQTDGWPNHNVEKYPELIQPGKFNSPHGGFLAENGDIYLAEWIIGGRITKLERQ